MSQRTLTFKHLVDGVLTDVASVVLADPTAAYGVKRTDTNAVVIAANVVTMQHVSTGYYTYTDVLLDSGLPYSWYAKITDVDGTVDFEPYTEPVVSAHYGSVQGVQELLGATNATTDWDINSDGIAGTIAAEQERALTAADNQVNLFLAFWQITPPKSTETYYYVLQDAANRIAAVTSYRFRGEPTSNGKPANPYQFYLDEAKAMLEMLVRVLRPGILPGVFSFVPTADPSAATSTDEFSAWWW